MLCRPSHLQFGNSKLDQTCLCFSAALSPDVPNSWSRPALTCEQLSDLDVRGLPQQSHQSGYPSAVLEGDLVVVVGFAVHQVSQGSAGTAVDVGHPVVQQVHQQLDAALPPDLRKQEGITVR